MLVVRILTGEYASTECYARRDWSFGTNKVMAVEIRCSDGSFRIYWAGQFACINPEDR